MRFEVGIATVDLGLCHLGYVVVLQCNYGNGTKASVVLSE